MAIWFGAALVLALGALTAARFLEAPHFLHALIVMGGALGLGLAMAVGLVLRRLIGVAGWRPWGALVMAVAAVAARQALLGELGRDPALAVTINFSRLALASSSVLWGAVALLWGAAAVADALEPAPGRRRLAVGALLGGAAAVTLALYALGPLWALAGLRLNHWTLLGLLGLAGLAHGAGVVYRKIVDR